MKYKLKEPLRNNESKTRLSAKGKMIFLILWSVVCVTLYLTLLKFFAMTPVIVMELLLLFGVILIFISTVASKLESARNPDGSERLTRLEDRIKLFKILILPPIFIVLVDFFISLYSFSSIKF